MCGVEVWNSLHRDRERALRRADLALAISNHTLDKFRKLHGDLANVKVCWLSTEADDPPPFIPTFAGPPTVLVVGTVSLGSFYKGHKEIVECWHEVIAAVPDARLVMVGAGNGLDHLKSLIASSPARDSIEVKGFVSNDALPGLWRGAHVMALPSRNEGFGLVYAEAMRHSLPVIASVHDAGREINVDDDTGFNVNLDRPGELSERLIYLLNEPDICQRLGKNGHERWRQHFRFGVFEQRLRDSLLPFLGR
jgi:phosphatidylinositol alpha-1,6-mannosyltransferase